MKRIYFIFALILSLLLSMSGCNQYPSSISQYEYNNIPWNSSVLETIDLLGVSDDKVTYGELYESNGITGQNIVIEDFEAFGYDAKYAIFGFEGYLNNEPGLASIQFFYDGIDADLLKKNLVDLYGESIQTFLEYNGYDGEEDTWTEKTSSENITYWYSDIKLKDILSKRDIESAWNYFNQELKPAYPKQSFDHYLDQPVASIVLNTQYAHPEWFSEIVIGISGGNALFFKQLTSE